MINTQRLGCTLCLELGTRIVLGTAMAHELKREGDDADFRNNQPVTCLLREFPPGAYRTPELETFISSLPLLVASQPTCRIRG